jgi:thioredoxin 1
MTATLTCEPSRETVDALPGPVVVEFGTSSCGYCQAARPLIAKALAEFPHIRHVVVEDGQGQRLGRSFGIKLWPTLVFLLDGAECMRLVRPTAIDEIRRALSTIAVSHASIHP